MNDIDKFRLLQNLNNTVNIQSSVERILIMWIFVYGRILKEWSGKTLRKLWDLRLQKLFTSQPNIPSKNKFLKGHYFEEHLKHRCPQVDNTEEGVPEVFAKIPRGGQGFKEKFLISGFVAFLLTSVLKFAWGEGPLYLPSPPLCAFMV
jgi:hypothetical protein